jgi:hypothetical protein
MDTNLIILIFEDRRKASVLAHVSCHRGDGLSLLPSAAKIFSLHLLAC